MRPNVRRLVELVEEAWETAGPVYEFGAYRVEGQEELANLRPLFPGREYVGCDQRAGPGVDRILDLERLDLADDAVPLALCLDTLEHVERPWLAVAEMARVLRPGGLLVLAVPFSFPIHEEPQDYWRFTPQGLASLLLAAFQLRPEVGGHFFVASQGHPIAPHTVAGVALKYPAEDFRGLVARCLRLEAHVTEHWHGEA